MIRTVGSKGRLAPALLELTPATRYYVEPFAGSARVAELLLRDGRFRHTEVIINDLDYAVYTYWSAIKSNYSQFREAALMLIGAYGTHSSRRHWHLSTRNLVRDKNAFKAPAELAAAYFLLCACSYLRTGAPNAAYKGGEWNDKGRLYRSINRIAVLEELLQRATVTNVDYWTCMKSFRAEEAYFYLDPPYQLGKSESVYYCSINHEEFFSRITSSNYRWMLTYACSKELEKRWLLAPRWHDKDIGPAVHHMTRSVRTDFLIRSTTPGYSMLSRYRDKVDRVPGRRERNSL